MERSGCIRMKRLIRMLVFAPLLALLVFAVPAAAMAGSITQLPNTTGESYLAGSPLTITWVSEGIPDGVGLELHLASSSAPGSLFSVRQESGLPLSGSTPVYIPTEGGPYFYYLRAEWVPTDDSAGVVYSDAYSAWLNEVSPWWFTVVIPAPEPVAPSVYLNPLDQGVTAGATATFLATADGVPAPDVQWQVDDGNGWTDIDGATGEDYTTSATTVDMNGWLYRAVFSNTIDGVIRTATSSAAQLTVKSSVSISAPTVSQSRMKGKTTATFHADVLTAGAASQCTFTLHLYRQTKVKGKSVWGTEITVPMTVDASGLLSASRVMARGKWLMYVTSDATTDFGSSSSDEVLFTVK
jgi:hypothetical protein